MDKNVVIYDEEFKHAAKEIDGYCQALINYMETYKKSINEIRKSVIKDVLISAKLEILSGRVEDIRISIKNIADKAPKNCKKYVSEIDKADKFLY